MPAPNSPAWRAVRAMAVVELRRLLEHRTVLMVAGGFLGISFMLLATMIFLDKGRAAVRVEIFQQMFYGTLLTVLGFVLCWLGLFLGDGMFAEEIKSRALQQFLVRPLKFWKIVAGKLGGCFLFLLAVLAAYFIVGSGLGLSISADLRWEVSGMAFLLLPLTAAAYAAFSAAVCQLAGKPGSTIFGMSVSFYIIGAIRGEEGLKDWTPLALQAWETNRAVLGWLLPPIWHDLEALKSSPVTGVPWSSLFWLFLHSIVYVSLFGWLASVGFGFRGRYKTP